MGVVWSLTACRRAQLEPSGNKQEAGGSPAFPGSTRSGWERGFSAPVVVKAVSGLCQLITKHRACGCKWESVPMSLVAASFLP